MSKSNYLVSAIINGDNVEYTVRNVSKSWRYRIARNVGASLFCSERISILKMEEYNNK